MGHPRQFDRTEAKRLRDTGLTFAEVGAALGVSAVAVWKCLGDSYLSAEDRLRIVMAYTERGQEYRPEDVAAEIGVSVSTVRAFLARHLRGESA